MTDQMMYVTKRPLRWLLDGLSLDQKQAHPPVTARTILSWDEKSFCLCRHGKDLNESMSNKKPMDKTTTLTIEQLQYQIEEQKRRIAFQNQQISELTLKLKWYEEQFRLSQKKRFGSSSEKTDEAQLTLPLFNEAETTANPAAEELTIETITYNRRKKSGKQEEQLKDLPVEIVEYRLPEDEQTCSSCGNPLHEMSVEVRQEVKVIPTHVKVVKHVRHVYACRHSRSP
ncbi:hypothetical protein CULT_2470002 [[Clostridium] ultunense Esp]|nr:hypothetical protein CULT_2470002 [[Clostridium] ultunense Esp]